MQTRFSTRDHQRVAYDIAGPAGAPAVVLLHDLLGQRSSMAPIRHRLVDAARCISVDLRGHGASATISGAAIDLRELALDVAAVLDQEEVSTAILVGHGLGAAVAGRLAAEHAALVTAVIAIEPPNVGLDGKALTETDRRAADLAYKGLADAALAAYLTPRLGPTWRDELVRPAAAALRRHAPALATLVSALEVGRGGDLDRSTMPTVSVAAKPGRLDLASESVEAVVEAVGRLLGLGAR